MWLQRVPRDRARGPGAPRRMGNDAQGAQAADALLACGRKAAEVRGGCEAATERFRTVRGSQTGLNRNDLLSPELASPIKRNPMGRTSAPTGRGPTLDPSRGRVFHQHRSTV